MDWQKYPPRLALPEVCRPGDGGTTDSGEANDHKRYIHRHNERRATGRSADKLVELVGKHNPRIEEELRIYVARFPWKVAPLLAEAKKVFLPAKATHSGEQDVETVTKETDTEAKSKRRKKAKKGKDKKQRKEKKSKAKDMKQVKKQRKEKKSKAKDKKREGREPAKEGETVDAPEGEPMPCPAARALPTTWHTNWTGGATTAPLRPPAKTVDRPEAMTQHPRRQLWCQPSVGRARRNHIHTYSWLKLPTQLQMEGSATSAAAKEGQPRQQTTSTVRAKHV